MTMLIKKAWISPNKKHREQTIGALLNVRVHDEKARLVPRITLERLCSP